MKATTRLDLGMDTSGRPIFMTARMKAAFDEACDRASVTPTIVQGAFMALAGGGAADSAGYHDLSGCIDTRVWNLTVAEQDAVIREGRKVGWAIWLRDHRHGMDPHMHWVLLDEPNCAPGAVWQMSEYRAGRDGLASRGPDYHWRPNPIPTFHYEEDDMPDKDTFQDWVANTPVPKQGGKPGETQALKWAVAQARQRATNAQDAARDAVSALGDVAKLIGDSTLTEEARAAFAADIAHRTAKTVERLDAAAMAEQLEVTVKEEK